MPQIPVQFVDVDIGIGEHKTGFPRIGRAIRFPSPDERGAGALGAKLTGAGGGGSVVALVPSQAVAEEVLAAWKGDGFEGFATCVAPETRARSLESEAAP